MKIFVFIILITSCFTPILVSAKETQIDSILASVNGDPVSLLDVLLETSREEQRLASIYSAKEREDEVRVLRKKVVDEIISRKLIYKEFEKHKFQIPRQFVEDALGDLSSIISDGSIAGLRKKAEEMGVSFESIRQKALEKVAVDIMVNEQCFRGVYVTPKDTFEYYQKKISDYSQPSQILLRFFEIKKNGRFKDKLDTTIEEIKTAMSKKGVDFKELVKLYSEDPQLSENLGASWIDENKLRPEFAKALLGISPGESAGPVKIGDSYYFLNIADWKPEKVTPFKEVKDKIRDKLESDSKRKKYFEYIKRLKKDAIIRYFFKTD